MTDKEPLELGFVKSYQPAVITADFPAMRKKLDELLEPYHGITKEALAQAPEKDLRQNQADLNKIINSVEDARKAIKRSYNDPLKEFESGIKELLKPAYEAKEPIHAALEEKKRQMREQKRDALIQHYEEFAPMLTGVVSYEQLEDPKWMNKGTSLKTAKEQLEQKVVRVSHDWESLKAQKDSMQLFDRTEAEFFRTLDLGHALQWNREQVERQQAIDEMKAEVEPQPVQAPEPEPVQTEPVQQPEPAPQPQQKPAIDANESMVVFEVRVPHSLIQPFIAAMRGLGVHGRKVRVE